MTASIFITDERRIWMRLRDHAVVFDNEPDFPRFLNDPSGSILRVLRIWVADSTADLSRVRFYVGSVRRCDCGTWMSHDELVRLFRRATVTARMLGENTGSFRSKLSRFLREYFGDRMKNDA